VKRPAYLHMIASLSAEKMDVAPSDKRVPRVLLLLLWQLLVWGGGVQNRPINTGVVVAVVVLI
jgi:hypothetical protein